MNRVDTRCNERESTVQAGRRLRSASILAVVTLAIVAVTSAFSSHYRRDTSGPHAEVGDWTRAAQWWQHGKCSKCHRDAGIGEQDDPHLAGVKPESHRHPNWQVTHGRSDIARESRCYVCHSSEQCRSCHDRRPASHTAGFVRPSSDHVDATRHALLARVNRTSCLVCHDRLAIDCGTCHAPSEISQWQTEAARELSQWPSLTRNRRHSEPMNAIPVLESGRSTSAQRRE